MPRTAHAAAAKAALRAARKRAADRTAAKGSFAKGMTKAEFRADLDSAIRVERRCSNDVGGGRKASYTAGRGDRPRTVWF